jgi:regulator of nucleoside diphosphate kinase
MIEKEADMANIYITNNDMNRLKTLIADAIEKNPNSRNDLQHLNDELDRAEICEQQDIPKDVITMNSKVHLVDLSSNEDLVYTLVYPSHANVDLGRISVLAPIGTAMIGYRVGDEIKWPVPGGTRRLKVKEVIYQPEASGDFLS